MWYWAKTVYMPGEVFLSETENKTVMRNLLLLRNPIPYTFLCFEHRCNVSPMRCHLDVLKSVPSVVLRRKTPFNKYFFIEMTSKKVPQSV